MNIKTKIAVGAGYNFTITDTANVRGIAIKNTYQLVKVNGKVYPLHKGKTYEDSRKIAVVLDDCSNEMIIDEYLVNKYSLIICKGDIEEERVFAYLSKKDIDIIRKSLTGEYNAQYLIELEDGRKIDVGIIDECKGDKITISTNNEPFNLKLKPCPFCGTDLSEFPQVMTVKPVRTEEYLLAKLEHKKIIGSDAGYNVFCVQCGTLGARGMTKEEAINKWNKRKEINYEQD